MLAVAFSKSLYSDLKFKSVFFLAANDDWGRGTVDSFKHVLEGLGAKTVGTEFFEYSHADFYTLLTKVRAANPDLIVVAAETQAAATLVKQRSEEHTSELQSLMRNAYAVFCLKKNTNP